MSATHRLLIGDQWLFKRLCLELLECSTWKDLALYFVARGTSGMGKPGNERDGSL